MLFLPRLASSTNNDEAQLYRVLNDLEREHRLLIRDTPNICHTLFYNLFRTSFTEFYARIMVYPRLREPSKKQKKWFEVSCHKHHD